jgi:hypothetical protein
VFAHVRALCGADLAFGVSIRGSLGGVRYLEEEEERANASIFKIRKLWPHGHVHLFSLPDVIFHPGILTVEAVGGLILL